MTLDMVRGRPVSLLLRFALPLMLSSLLQQLYTMCDSVIVGRLLGTVAFTATGSASYLNWFPLGMLLGAINGFGVTLSQRFGAKKQEEFRRFFGCAILISLSLGLFFSLAGSAFAGSFLRALNTPAELMDLAQRYIRVVWAGFCVTALMNIFNTALMAMGDSRTPLIALAVSSIVNIVLDIVFIRFFRWDVEGAALATILAQAAAGIPSFLALRRSEIGLPRLHHFRPRKYVVKELLRLGLPQLLSFGVIASGELVVQAAVNSCGVVFVTGMTASRRYFNLTNIIGGGLEGAVVTFVGQNYGAGKYDRIRQGARSAFTIGLCASLVTGLLVYIFAEPMIRFFIPDGSAEAVRIGTEALRVQAVFLSFLYLLCEHRAAIQGMGNAIIPMCSGILELAARVGVTLLLPLWLGQKGLYFTDAAAWVPTMLMLTVSYHIRRKNLPTENA